MNPDDRYLRDVIVRLEDGLQKTHDLLNVLRGEISDGSADSTVIKASVQGLERTVSELETLIKGGDVSNPSILTRLALIEDSLKKQAKASEETVKGKWALIIAVVTSISSLLATIISLWWHHKP